MQDIETPALGHNNPPLSETATEARRRRTFAIIAHPDAGKTTLTEQLLLLGGAIQIAGQVRAKGERRRTRSDWMKIEQDRGISVATSVMTFEYAGQVFNLLDTPGHEDFSEDTYRTLSAVDAAVMVIDAAKGIEAQTRKLFEVCRLRDIPIVTFINKMDREAREPLELLDEIEKTLALDVTPATWPIGSGRQFAGVYDMTHSTLRLLGEGGERDEPVSGLDDARIDALLGEDTAATLRESAEIAEVYPEFEVGSFREGHLTPIYFGSALRGFGVKHLLDGLARFAPSPSARRADARTVQPEEEKLSGFVFKIQANTDLQHRDRVAFLRICSGKLRKGARLKQVRTGKSIPVNAPLFFFAKERQVAEEAWPGDVVGIANHGVLRIGDTLTDGEELNFRGVPSFAPEILRRVRLDDPMLAKKLRKALDQLADEGVVQVFRPLDGSQPVVGVVGQLQLDVLSSRMVAEYGVNITFEQTSWSTMRWVAPKEDGVADRAALDRFLRTAPSQMAEDHDNEPVAFFTSDWGRKRAEDEFPMLRFLSLREQHAIEGSAAA